MGKLCWGAIAVTLVAGTVAATAVAASSVPPIEAVSAAGHGRSLYTLFYRPGEKTRTIDDDLSIVQVNTTSVASVTGTVLLDQGRAITLRTLVSPRYKTAAVAYNHSAVGFDPIYRGLTGGYRSGRRIRLAPGYYDVLVKAKVPLADTSEVGVTRIDLSVKAASQRAVLLFAGQIALRRHR